ncbi:uncharacterized protein LOC126776760 [Nymphalis io]|uniref:uncharacterized protein LOC126776760 n=1 Tax=Inachis io TaxID=171585 RepID=UPI0021678B2F|nr:uncharacterized protein LOC126776760 [Nymphalis io]
MTNTKQLKITKLFKKGAPKIPEDYTELLEEINELENKLQEKHNELFQIQRNKYRKKVSPINKKKDSFIRPQKIILSNAVENLKRSLELMSMLTGMEVQSYVADDHCCIVYHMQHSSGHLVKHGLRIDMSSDGNVVSKSSLPLGFNLTAVMEDFDNVMMPDCLGSIRKALVAYYDRQEQFEALTKLLHLEAETFKILDGSHIEISFFAQSQVEEEEEQFSVTLILDYRVYDIRPKTYCFKEIGLPEGASEILKEQCLVFKRKPLNKAFKEAFMNDISTYKLVQQLGPRRSAREVRKTKRLRPNKHQYNNDDTFLPEDCSDQGDDDDVIEDIV